MDAFKLRILRASLPETQIPVVRALATEEAEALRSRVAKAFGLSEVLSAKEFVEALATKGSVASAKRAGSKIDLRDVCREAGLCTSRSVYINWGRFDDVDEVSFDALADLFEYFWYPASDDIDIVDEHARWIISVSHFGSVAIAYAVSSMPGSGYR